MVSYGFGRFRPVFVGSGPHFLEKRVQEIKRFFSQFSEFVICLFPFGAIARWGVGGMTEGVVN